MGAPACLFLRQLSFAALLLSISFPSLQADPPAAYYTSAEGLTGAELKSALHKIIKNHTVVPYFALREPLRHIHEDPENPEHILLEYSLTSVPKYSRRWNREHLWPRFRGNRDHRGPDDSDLFHVVPCDVDVNSARDNKYFDVSDSNDLSYTIPAHSLAPQTSFDSDSWEPPLQTRGDIARAMFYMDVRYDGNEPETSDMELVSTPRSEAEMGNLYTLLRWHEQDPPDEAERRRNDLIHSEYQHNRNPFIDRPEWVHEIWGNGGWH